MERIFAIDPGNEYSGYIICEAEEDRIENIIDAGKVDNHRLNSLIRREFTAHQNDTKLLIELIESFGMPVGRTVFETCIWIGRFIQQAVRSSTIGVDFEYITRREEKLAICGTVKAKDANIRQALIDKYAKFDYKNGKGTKKEPDFFYGFKADMWSAAAVVETYLQKNVKRSTKF